MPTQMTKVPARATIPMVLDMKTIRNRVAAIKASWSHETAKSRAAEGAKRREDLENMLLELMCDIEDSEGSCDLEECGSSLVG